MTNLLMTKDEASTCAASSPRHAGYFAFGAAGDVVRSELLIG